ncbi:MAG: TRAP transporter permease [Desulfobacteraceae bacterium]|nr:MAG: TRAP transporter permease [Desulfobacteraceae bacterium]
MEAKIKRLRHFLAGTVAICWSTFQLYGAWNVTLDALILRAAHVSFALSLAYLLNPSFKSKPRLSFAIDSGLVILGIGVGLHIITDFDRLIQRVISVDEMTFWDLFFGALAVPLILEATRRAVRSALAIVGACFAIYALTGPYLFGILKHSAANIAEWVEYLYLTTDGIFGVPTGVSATFVFLFILFVAFLQRTRVGQFYLDVAFALTGRARGGAAKASVVASSFFGTISGSAVANTVGTGSFTIPLIIKSGYKPYFAGAVEALSSTGGQLMPPIMGAAAFVMAELTGIPYWDICKSAAFPALLFYGAAFLMIHLEAVKTGLRGMDNEEVPNLVETLKRGSYMVLPIVVLIIFLVLGYTVTKAALMSIISTVVVFVLDRRSLDALGRITKGFSKGARDGIYSFGQEAASAIVGLGKTLDQGARMAVTVAVACICAGIIVGVITLSGFGLRFSGLISAFSGGYVLFALVLVAMTSIILGMGMSTTADYITVSTLAVPALYVLGVNTLSAHMFAMYFACLSMISPPVALAAYAAAGIAQTGPWRVCFTAMRLGIVAYMIPFMFAYNPALLLVGPVGEVVQACVTSLIGVVALSGATIGFFFRRMNPIERILMGGAGISMIFPGLASDYIGIPLAVLMVAWNYFTRKR